ncbi:cysteine desulfurase-like protein [Actinosynnema pretiosum subsp. pretiosum]|uniref:Cysteine desulfurase-like protein n=2 Tax=Actinosynnema pretiosum TaxID=42197 RepID=A0A290YZ07_9PSEU|nr:cysteine desulfurase-like protein [Actinosynnema pretiosum]ATE51985.1 cysteine desulfurase-like protein [Actinosynnema pretiosum]AXX27505.1 Cysteine desulfurase [Actinosynnema pretiosum subsp. pretiosum]QUF01781.1 cysteine desulfurase-like protein [Actinosynnema pretiosum subsp. pretiosum]
MAFDVARVRGLFPALGDGWVHLDAPAGMQVPEQVATAVSTALRAPVSGPGGIFPASQRAEAIVDAARRAVADLVGADPAGVVLGPSSAVLLQRLSDALSEGWFLGDEVVVSRLDHPGNIAPWQRAAQRTGSVVRFAEVDIETCELPAWQYDELITDKCKLVAVTAASGAVGTRPDLPRIGAVAREHGALVVVDASAAAPFVPLDITSMRADVVAVSANTWGGPPVGALVFRDPSLLDLLPSVAVEAGARGPERLELGPHAYPLLAGLVASVEYLAGLDDAAIGPRREKLLTSLGSVKAYQAGLLANLIHELRSLRHVTVIGDAMRRVPALAFTVAGVKSAEAVEHLSERGVCAFADPGQHGVFSVLGVGEVGGAVRVGLAHYTNAAEVDDLVRAVAELG